MSEVSKIKRKREKKAEQKKEKGEGRGRKVWTEEELVRFIAGVKTYGRDWKKVAEHVGSRDRASVRLQATYMR